VYLEVQSVHSGSIDFGKMLEVVEYGSDRCVERAAKQ
jgi:hypothetical protein